MAKKNNEVNAEAQANIPEGFISAQPEVSGAYFRYAEGATIQGILKGRFPKPGNRPGYIYQVRVNKPCVCTVRVGDKEYEEQEVLPNTLVSIDEKASIEGLSELCDDADNVWEIFVKVVEKQSLSGGRSFWKCYVGKKVSSLPY